jgi:hypothetical protein
MRLSEQRGWCQVDKGKRHGCSAPRIPKLLGPIHEVFFRPGCSGLSGGLQVSLLTFLPSLPTNSGPYLGREQPKGGEKKSGGVPGVGNV